MKFQPVKYFTNQILIPLSAQLFEAKYNKYRNKINEIVIPNYVFENRNFEILEIQKRHDGIYFIIKEQDELK